MLKPAGLLWNGKTFKDRPDRDGAFGGSSAVPPCRSGGIEHEGSVRAVVFASDARAELFEGLVLRFRRKVKYVAKREGQYREGSGVCQ